ncbi:hypothetical protein [Chelativorans sp.]|uniref:hypothetical protein n=1 Tax=Chelativorans sp. TaxID=2203393 RepID=UPI002811753F|nr:hypothetical protein [Chelativorans sp.]
MIRTEQQTAAPSHAFLETDPKEIIATAMLELSFQGRTVTAEAIGEQTDLTEEEIEANWRAARDVARIRLRQQRAGRVA